MYIPQNVIKAAIPCAATKDIRYYLKGALVAYTRADKTLRVVSTDGAVMSCFGITHEDCPDDDDFSVIVPLDTLKNAAKAKGVAGLDLVSRDGRHSLGDFIFKPLEGKYPDYRRLIPEAGCVSGTVAQFDLRYISRAHDALAAYYAPRKVVAFKLEHRGRAAAVMHLGESCAIVLIMPVNMPAAAEDWSPYRGFK